MPAPAATPSTQTPAPGAAEELARQVDVLVERGYPGLLGIEPEAFVAALAPLAEVARSLEVAQPDPEDRPGSEERSAALPMGSGVTTPEDYIPFVLVIAGALPLDEAAARMRLGTRQARLMLTPAEIPAFRPLDDLDIPDEAGTVVAYLLTDIDTGSEFCSITPETALTTIRSRGRTPLTIAEGIALVTQRPDMLRKNKCFSLSGSRCGDQRVPAIWISEKAPKLGWCWDRNPHTWLGSASAGRRVV